MKLRLLAVIFVAIFVLSACQLPAGLSGRSTSQSTAEDIEWIFNSPSDPIDFTVAVDPSRQAEALIPIEGGTLSATGADGTQYTLTIPGDALLYEARIKMTPLASISGMPFGSGPVFAVQIEPEGLFFNNFVTLTITPSETIPIDQQILYGYKAEGKDLTLALPVVDSQEIKFQLLHFSGYGVTKGLLADTEPVRQRLGADAEARLQSQVAGELQAERQRQLLGTGDTSSDIDFSAYFDQWEEQVVKPRVAAAGESCAAGRLALQTVLGFERQKQLLGVAEDSSMEQYVGLMNTVGRVCLQEEYELCADEHIIHRMIPVWLGLERQMQLLGYEDTTLTQEGKKLVSQCLRFDLEFYSNASFNDGPDGYDSIVKSTIKLRFDPDQMTFKTQAPLINELFEFRAPGCSVINHRGGGTFDAIEMIIESDTHSPTDALGYTRDLKLTYYPGITSESFTITCEDDSYTSPPSAMWTGIFILTHFDELDQTGTSGESAVPDFSSLLGDSGGLPIDAMPALPAGAGFRAEDFEILGDEYFAKKEWIKEDTYGLGITEAGTLKLYHRPGQ